MAFSGLAKVKTLCWAEGEFRRDRRTTAAPADEGSGRDIGVARLGAVEEVARLAGAGDAGLQEGLDLLEAAQYSGGFRGVAVVENGPDRGPDELIEALDVLLWWSARLGGTVGART
jgi:hypothetical protein